MPDHYDRLENRTTSSRENALLRDLRHILAVSKPRAPALRARLKGLDLSRPLTRDDLAQIAVLRHADLLALQKDSAPFGGLAATRLGGLKQTFLTPRGLVSLEGQAKDWWGMGRALFAAGLRKGSLVLNCFPYELLPQGHMIESGACALGCPVIPAGRAELDRKVEAVARLRPQFFCGEAGHLKLLLDRCDDLGVSTTSLKNALVMGTISAGLRSEFAMRNVTVRCAYALPEVGVVAFESVDEGVMILNEGLVLEIVAPGSGAIVRDGTEGEIVITRINADYPLLRYATGAVSSIDPRPSSCGRTNTRLRTPLEDCIGTPCDQSDVVHVAQVAEIADLYPEAGRMQLHVFRRRGGDAVHLRVEHGSPSEVLIERLTASLAAVTSLEGTVEVVKPGALDNQDSVVLDDGKPGRSN